jgi:hypothetical protein
MAPSSRTARLQYADAEMVDGLHRGTGIVDRRRKGLASDVDLLSGAESDVLLLVRSKPIRTLESAAAFKDPALAWVGQRGGPYPAKNSSPPLKPGSTDRDELERGHTGPKPTG